MTRNLISDVSEITKISKSNLISIAKLAQSIISHDVVEDIKSSVNVTTVDIGIGTLSIVNDSGVILYKFIPSKDFEECIKRTYQNKNSDLTSKVSNSLGKKINSIYKELL